MNKNQPSAFLGAAITKSASRQIYYTIRFFADRDLAADAFRAYGYFRWVDDMIDAEKNSGAERIVFAQRQQSLLDACYQGESPNDLQSEEWILADLIRHDAKKNSGLRIYLRNMMDVMLFDARRRGRVVSQNELSVCSRKLAVAVTEALYYFIRHDDPSLRHDARYLAVTAAHIVHMLRDTREDVEAGYFNIPQEVLAAHGIFPQDVTSNAYREWVCGQAQLARGYFLAAQECTAQVKNWRLRLAGFLYTARFEWMLNAIERDNYCLRYEYPERKSLQAGLWMVWSALSAMLALPAIQMSPSKLATQSVRIEKR